MKEFSSHDGYNFYNVYVKLKGFGNRKVIPNGQRRKTLLYLTYLYVIRIDSNTWRIRANKGRMCFVRPIQELVKMTINLDRSSEKWIIKSFIEEHNGHPLTTPSLL